MLIGAMFAYFMVLSDKELNAFEYEMYSKFEILGLFELVWSVLLVIGAIKVLGEGYSYISIFCLY